MTPDGELPTSVGADEPTLLDDVTSEISKPRFSWRGPFATMKRGRLESVPLFASDFHGPRNLFLTCSAQRLRFSPRLFSDDFAYFVDHRAVGSEPLLIGLLLMVS